MSLIDHQIEESHRDGNLMITATYREYIIELKGEVSNLHCNMDALNKDLE